MRRELFYHRVHTNARREAIQAIIQEYLEYEMAIASNGCQTAEKMYWIHPCEQLMSHWLYWQNCRDRLRYSLEYLPSYCERLVQEEYRHEYGQAMGTRCWGAWESFAADGITRGRPGHREARPNGFVPRPDGGPGREVGTDSD